MNKNLIIGLGVSFFIFAVLILISLNPPKIETGSTNQIESQEQVKESVIDKVQVYLFHTTRRCSTCIAIGRLAGETVYEYFQPEIRDGKIEFREINIDLAENKELAQKFQASGSALMINVVRDNQDYIQEDTEVWRLTQNQDQFKQYLKDKLKNLFVQ